jgi:nucleoside phosphorylase
VFFVGCAALLNERHPFAPNQVFVARSAYDADKYEISSTGASYDMSQHRGDLSIIRNIEVLKIAGQFDPIRVETRRHFVSGSVFMKDKNAQLRQDVLERFPPDAVVWEMEAFSVLKALFNYRSEGSEIGVSVIKGISDFGDEDAQTDKVTKQKIATKNAMFVVTTLLKNLAPL